MIDTPVLVKTNKSVPLWKVLAHILWELTFNGWTEKLTDKNQKKLEKQLAKAMKEIKASKCITIPKKNNESFNLVIPHSVTKQIKDITTKYENKDKKSKV